MAPFDVRAFNSDNGPEFLNSQLKTLFNTLQGKVIRTRSRSYRKNDNAHVEQKNSVQVRALSSGYGRIDDPTLLPLMNRINKLQGLIKNLFTPTMRLISKERGGGDIANVTKRLSKDASTTGPESASVSEEKQGEGA